ncbi:MAG: hypothetical protein V1859_04900 [archaeon]
MKKIIAALSLILVIILAGCGEQTDQVSTTAPYIGGKDGIVMKFIEGMPPDYVFDNGGYGFGIAMQLDNVGEANVESGQAYVEIIGLNPGDFGKSTQADLKKSTTKILRGAKKNSDGTSIQGDRDVIEFGDLNYRGDLHGNSGIKLRAELCYNYKTYTSTMLCIKKNIVKNLGNQKICDPNGEKTPSNSAAPVHITSLRESPLGDNKVQIVFTIENVKDVKGTIFKRASVCDDSVNNPDLNKVWVDVKTDINGVRADCTGLMEGASRSQGYVTLYNGEPRTVTCTVDLSNVDSIFEKAYEITLDYNYLHYIERPLEIRDVSTNS